MMGSAERIGVVGLVASFSHGVLGEMKKEGVVLDAL